MKILHVCLAAFYIDNYGYQENILPKMHSIQGHNVEILASTETYLNGNEMKYLEPSTYKNEDGIKVTRVPYVNIITNFITRKLRVYKGVQKHLDNFKQQINIFATKEGRQEIVTSIKKEIRKANQKENYLDEEERVLLRNFINKIRKELELND